MNEQQKSDLVCLDSMQDMMMDKSVGGLGLITGPFVFRNIEYKTASLALEAYIKAFQKDGEPGTSSCVDYKHEVENLLSRHAAKHSTIDKSIQCQTPSETSMTVLEKDKSKLLSNTGNVMTRDSEPTLVNDALSSLPGDIIAVPSVAGESQATDVLLLPLKTRPVLTSSSQLTSEELRKIRERARHNYSYRMYAVNTQSVDKDLSLNGRRRSGGFKNNLRTTSEFTNQNSLAGHTKQPHHSLTGQKTTKVNGQSSKLLSVQLSSSGQLGVQASGRAPPSWVEDVFCSPASSILGGHLLKQDKLADRLTSTPQRPHPRPVKPHSNAALVSPIRHARFHSPRLAASDNLQRRSNRDKSPASDVTADLLLRLPSAKRVSPKTPGHRSTAFPHTQQVSLFGQPSEVLEERRPMSEFLQRIQRLLVTPTPDDTISTEITSSDSQLILNTERTWERTPKVSQFVSDKMDEKSQLANKVTIVDQFITECLSEEKQNKQNEERASPTLTGKRHPGGMEALKNMIFTMQTIATPSDSPTSSTADVPKVDEHKVTTAVATGLTSAVDSGLTSAVDNALTTAAVHADHTADTDQSSSQTADDSDAMTPSTKRLLADTISNPHGGESLERALVHLTRLKSLVKSQKDALE